MVHLPKLMLGDNLPLLVRITTALVDDYSPTVECNAEDLITAEPVALCLLAAAFGQLERRGQSARIRGLRPEVKENLEQLDVLHDWLRQRPQQLQPAESADSQSNLRACRVATLEDANELANILSREIATFVPGDDLGAVLEADPSLRRYRVVEQPLGYVITELLDNSLNHARASGFGHARAWVAAQYYRVGDLLRVAVVDDGCGFLESLKHHPALRPKTHQNAISMAFQPFFSCKKDVGVFRDATHQGIGLTVCRDLCLRANGQISAASGTAWLSSPATPSETCRRLSPGYQGSVVMMAFHRRSITPGSLGEIFRRYQPDENLPIRFI
jgi:signal transduction histidine kinase